MPGMVLPGMVLPGMDDRLPDNEKDSLMIQKRVKMECIRQLAVKGTDPSFRMIPRLFPVMQCARRASKTEQNCSE